MFGISAATALAVGVAGGAVLSSMGSDGPDTSGMNQAALQQAQMSKEQLDFAKQIYADSAPDRAATNQRAMEISAAQLDSMRNADANARDLQAYNKETFRPLEQGIVRDAQNFDTEAERERLAGLAKGEVSLAGASARDMGERALTRSGVNPNDGAYGAMESNANTQIALGQSAAANKARSDALTLGRAMKMDAASLGRNLPSQQATQAGLALNAGNSSAANAAVPGQVTAGGAALMNTGYAGAQAGLSNAANTYGNIARINASAGDDSAMWGAAGNIAGQALSAYALSDKKEKTDRQPVKGEVALSAARRLPVETWKYKKGSVADDGGKTHAGPMAQKVRDVLGEAVAPGGKMVDVNSMTAMTLAAVKALDKKVTQLEKRRG